MADYLDGKIYPVGTAGIEGIGFSFTRPEGITNYSLVNAAIALRIWRLEGTVKLSDGTIPDKTRALPPVVGGPTITLTVGTGLSLTTNTAALLEGAIRMTQAQLVTLLSTATVGAYSYQWVITPVGYGAANKPLGEGYNGVFGLVAEGYSLEAAAKA
jgi:hypothetical protein